MCILDNPYLASYDNEPWFHINILTAYTGDTCSEDKNGCSDIECFSGVECLDVPAPGVGATCRACPNGFTGNGLRCYGIAIIC